MSTFKLLNDYVSNQMQCQEPLARCAIRGHILELAVDCWPDSKVLGERKAFEFLALFIGAREVLTYGTDLWRRAANWVKLYTRSEDLVAALQEMEAMTLSLKAKASKVLALKLLFKIDGCLSDSSWDQAYTIFKTLLGRIEDKSQRPYSSCQLPEILTIYELVQLVRTPRRREGKDFLQYSDHAPDNSEVLKIFRDNLSTPTLIQNLFRYVISINNDPSCYETAVKVTSLLSWCEPNCEAQSQFFHDALELARKSLPIHHCLVAFSNDVELLWRDMSDVVDGIACQNPQDKRSYNDTLGSHQANRWTFISQNADRIKSEGLLDEVVEDALKFVHIGGVKTLAPLIRKGFFGL